MRVLETDRLVLSWLGEDDAPFILALLNEPSFIRNIGDRGARSVPDAARYIANGPVASYQRHGFGMYKVQLKDGAVPIGMCGLVKRDYLPDADIGFAFLPQYWSKGYAFESAAAVMRYARESLGLRRIVAIVSPHNAGSMAVLRKIGLEHERNFISPGPPPEELALFAPLATGSTA